MLTLLISLLSACDTSQPEWRCGENTWPVQVPEDLEAQGFQQGETILDVRAFDQHNDPVCLWQFYRHTFLLHFSAEWSGVPHEVSGTIQGIQEDYKEHDFLIVSLLLENSSGNIPSHEELVMWSENYNIDRSPVLRPTEELRSQLVPSGVYPRLLLIDSTLTVQESDIYPLEEENIRAIIDEHL